MLKDLHVAHLTGTATVIENRLLEDTVSWDRNARTTSQMFFKPYESPQEFVFCARHTLQPIALIALTLMDPLALVAGSCVIAVGIAGFLALSGINTCLGNERSAKWAMDMVEEIFSRVCQTIINLIVLPLAALSMLTRGISTGLQAADIYDYDAPEAQYALP
ncbi:hypothetical protein TUM19329_25610 [Legionella antarctica]|uniref:Uncharacterized protein n=1 Tax=Legionella antarctica TaxID=2708020 RepID=A0A6F8T7T2_9GAMM|nr:hypothetical protein [Legionella antarctica]BCA96200.1 hypothetical protein TUM19329_25610 [Legionella antarctica]